MGITKFLNHFHIDALLPPRRLFFAIMRAFSRIPYENITKIIRRAEADCDEKARRSPDEVIDDHIRWGAGGTCFSLTATLCRLTRGLGFEAEYLSADRGYGQNTHSALLVRIDDEPYLVDPGFLIMEPVPFSLTEPREITSGGERLTLIPEEKGISLFTTRGGKRVHRLTYKAAPVGESEFYSAWNASFHWEMMRYPLLARVGDSGRIYLRGSMFQVSNNDSVNRVIIPEDELASKISVEFGIHPALVTRALDLLRSLYGKTQ